ncbi:MAG: HAD hydrolase family protein [Phascolarctobacterium sp.]|nr:HAD hydrolase family protein [Phascolarctobacterium sp.]
MDNLKKIKLLILDVDWVLTDGHSHTGGEVEYFKSFDVKDGLGISAAMRNGVQVLLVMVRTGEIVHQRAEDLGIGICSDGVTDKYEAVTDLISWMGLEKGEVAYMGDDLNDLPAFCATDIAFAPQDAAKEVILHADYHLKSRGGHGAVREAIEMILNEQGKWEGIVESYMTNGQGDRQ